MRIHFRFQYKNYPLSPELTRKSQRVGTLTHPIYGVMLGALIGILVGAVFSFSVAIPLIALFAGVVGCPILLSKYRKKKFAEFDREYQKILQAAKK